MSQGESVDSMSLDHVQLGAESVDRLIDNRRAPATKARYRTALRSIARWLEPIVSLDQHSTVFTTDDQGKVVPRIPIEEKYLIAFIGRINEQDQYGTYTVSGNEEKKETPVERPKKKSKKTPPQPSSSSSSSSLQTRSVTSAVSSTMTAETKRPIRKGYAVSTMEAIWSALKYEYERAGMILSETIHAKFSAALEGYKHKLADMALEGVWGKSSAKEVLDMKQIQGIAEHLFKNDPLFSWPYFLLEWNLACRKRSVAELMMNHLSLSNDCIRIAVVKSKTRQDGENTHSNRIHIYANPSLHFFCPFLALAMIIFTKSASSSLGTSLRLFEGEPASVAERFSQQLKKALDKVLGEELSKRFGSHSIRKSVMTYANSHPHGPPPLAISFRADHNVLGDNYSRYIVQGEGADQYVGRTVVGLPLHQIEFSILPPHFSSSSPPPSSDEWLLLVPNYLLFQPVQRSLFPFLLARILHAKKYILETIPPTHADYQRISNAAVFKLSFLKRYWNNINDTVHSSCFAHCSDTRLYGTGIPLWISQEKERKEMRDALNKLSNQLSNQVFDNCMINIMNT